MRHFILKMLICRHIQVYILFNKWLEPESIHQFRPIVVSVCWLLIEHCVYSHRIEMLPICSVQLNRTWFVVFVFLLFICVVQCIYFCSRNLFAKIEKYMCVDCQWATGIHSMCVCDATFVCCFNFFSHELLNQQKWIRQKRGNQQHIQHNNSKSCVFVCISNFSFCLRMNFQMTWPFPEINISR